MKFSENKHRYFPVVYAIAALCFCQSIAAQSGRRPGKNEASAKPPAAVETAANRQAAAVSTAAAATARVSSIVIVGEIQHGYAYYRSTFLGSAMKECMNELKARPQPLLAVVKGGKLTFTEAQEQAKKETDAYVLWLGFVVKDGGYGNETIDYIDYALLIPQTAKRLTYGRVSPGQQSVVAQGGVLRLPSQSKRSSSLTQMKDGAREIADTLMRGGWL